jgi:riboflavin kinase/FMN adenylyltransferase
MASGFVRGKSLRVVDLSALPGPFERGSSAVTVGTFDGVHLGHQKVLDELVQVARKRNERSVVVTFDPHPLRIVRPQHAPRLLTTREEKAAFIATFGVDVVAFVPFTQELADYEPRRFVQEILVDHFGLAHLIIGYDHGFGKGRSGDVDTLRAIGDEIGFEVDVVEPLQLGEHNVSSSRIRAQVAEGDVGGAAAGLGRPFSLTGTVIRGAGAGRQLGMPTANLAVHPEKLVPLEGIYVVRADGRPSVMHIGPRPSIPGAEPSLEVHILDFSGDLYGQVLTVEFLERIRGIEKFDSMDELAAAMQADAASAREFFDREDGEGGETKL